LSAQYETFEHEADIGIRGFGDSLEQSFENAAVALFSVITNVETIRPDKKKKIEASAPDTELLLIEWLNALLTCADLERMIFSKFSVTIKGTTLKGIAWGEHLDQERHDTKVEVKGATYHLLSVKEMDGFYTAQCVVDV
jgi:SHS2 domain-containing protein